MYQTLKYYLTRLGLAIFWAITLGFSGLYIVHETTLSPVAVDDDFLQWSAAFLGLVIGFTAYGWFGNWLFRRALGKLRDIDLANDEGRAARQFESLLALSYTSYFRPGRGAKLRDQVISGYAEYLLAAGRNDPAAVKVYLNAFLQEPRDSAFREPLLAALGRGEALSPDEVDLLLVVLHAGGYHDKGMINHLASVFLIGNRFTMKTEPVLLKAVEFGGADAPAIVRWVLPFLLESGREDMFALRFYLYALPYHPPEEDRARAILARCYSAGHLQTVDPDLHERCGDVFSELSRPQREAVLRSAMAEAPPPEKKRRWMDSEERRALARLKVRLGMVRSLSQYVRDGFVKLLDVLLSLSREMVLAGAGILAAVGLLSWVAKHPFDFHAHAPPPQAAKPAAAPKPAPKEKAEKGKSYTVQIAVMDTQPRADRFVEKMESNGVTGLYVIKTDRAAGGNWFKIRMGKYPTRAEAQKVAGELLDKKLIKSYFVIPLSAKPK